MKSLHMEYSRTLRKLASAFIVVFVAACNLSKITDSATTIDGELINPKLIDSREGARWVYLGAIAKFNRYYGIHVETVASFTDELALLPENRQGHIDARRNISSLSNDPYVVASSTFFALGQSTMVQLEQAVQLLDKHYDSSANGMRAHTYGLLSLLYSMFADVYCSGVAISESNWGGIFTPGVGLSTDSLYGRAISAADYGLALDPIDDSLKTFLLGVKARALNSLGRYAQASDLLSDVPTAYALNRKFANADIADNGTSLEPVITIYGAYNVINAKGANGLKWIADSPANQDMRIPIRVASDGGYIYPTVPAFISLPESTPEPRRIPFFSGIEARLIEAESHLAKKEYSQFMSKINEVRSSFRRRSGHSLADTTDPGTDDQRIDLLFRERAFSFWITGRRQGDMRRLVRQYSRNPATVWPTGISEGLDPINYGENYVLVPEVQGKGDEAMNNPNYNSCEHYEP